MLSDTTSQDPPKGSPKGSTNGRTAARAAITVVVLAMLAMWAYVVFLAFGPGRQPPIDRLDDPAFAVAAEARCSEALEDVATLPRAVDAESAEQRSDVVASANARFTAMLDDLEAQVPPGEDGALVRAWLADWRTYLQDRADYVAALLADPDARFLVSAKDREQITEYIDAFAADNHMPACATPLDVG